nr:MFS transporter [Nocardioides sp. zg-1230]
MGKRIRPHRVHQSASRPPVYESEHTPLDRRPSGPGTDARPGFTLAAACVGNAVEWYDFAIYGALGVVLAQLFLPASDPDTVLLAAFALYATAFLVRPLGAVVFGRRADARGRRGVFTSTLLLMSLATAAVGLLPVYAAIGLVAPVALLVLRGTQGLAAGGELGLAAVFIVESAPAGRRGAFAAWHTATLALGLAAGLGVGGLVQLLPDDQVTAGWWRAPFLLALPLGMVGVLLRRRGLESPLFLHARSTAARQPAPVRVVWSDHRRGALTGFAVIAAGSLAFNMFFVYLPNHLVATRDWAAPEALLASVIGLAAAAVSALVLGRLSDRLGRRPVVMGSLVGLVVGSGPVMALAHTDALPAIVLAEVLVGVAVGGVLSVSLLAEMFPTAVRATGLGLTAGMATALVGGTAPLVGQVVETATGHDFAPAAYVAGVAVVALAALRAWPETAFGDLP